MTLTTTDSRFVYDGDASTAAFSFPRKIIEAAHLDVYLYDEDDDSYALQTLNTHYTFAGVSLSNGIYASATVTFVTAPGSDKKVVLYRDPTLTQEADFTAESNVLTLLNRYADRVEMKLQRMQDQLDRAIRLPDGDYATTWANAYTKLDYASKVLGFSSTGVPEPLTNDGASTSVTATGSSTARTLAAWFQGIERGSVLAPEGDLFTALGANFWRNGERALYGAAASQYKGTNDKADGASFIGTASGGFNAFWLERSSQLASISLHGGIGVMGGSRKSDRYLYNGAVRAVWVTATVYAAGAIVGYSGRIYTTSAGGTSGGTPPTHTSGSVSDGGVTWAFTDHAYTAPIGLAGAVLSDVVDGTGAWAAYWEAVRTSAGGTTYGAELDVGNEGGDVTNNPYSIAPAGATIGHWVAAGRSASVPANPSTSAILIGKNNHTWNSGIVFDYQGITAGGYAIKYAALSNHAQGWFNSSSQEVFAVYSIATANNERTKIVADNRKIELYAVGGVMASFESGASAGTAADEHVRLFAYAAGNTFAELRAGGAASNLDLFANGKGTGALKTTGRFFQKSSKSTPYLLYASTDEITHAGATSTSETAIVTTQIPAGDIGPNGFLRVRASGSLSASSANNKQFRLRLGGIGGTNFGSVAHTTNTIWDAEWIIKNQNSQSEQRGWLYGNRGTDLVFSAVAGVDGTVDTSANQDLVLSFQVASAAESMTLESYTIEVVYGA